MTIRLGALGVLLATLSSFPIGAVAAPVLIDSSLSISHFIDNENGADDDDNYLMILERLRVRANARGITAGARLDTTLFYGEKGERVTEGRLERIYLVVDREHIKLTAGDFYKQLGRGLILALRKVDEVGFDVVLRGGEVAANLGSVQISVFGGRTNSVNIDNLKFKFVEEPEDILTGTEVKTEFSFLQLGLHGLYRQNRDNVIESDFKDAGNSVGAFSSATLLEGDMSIYMEGAFQETRLADQVTQGHAGYGTIYYALGDLITTIEAIQLNDFVQNGRRKDIKGQAGDFFRYNQPPTLERIDQETSKGIDERAGRLMLEYSLSEGDILLSSNALFKQEFPDTPSELTTLHAYGGSEVNYNEGRSRLSLSGGYRDLKRTGDGQSESFKEMKHVEGTWLQHLFGRTSARLATLMEFRTLEGDDYVRGSNFIGLENGEWGSLTFEYGLDNQRVEEGIRNHFYAGILSANVMRGLVIKGLAGTQRGGLKCVAGICRDYPSFAGAQVEVLFTQRL